MPTDGPTCSHGPMLKIVDQTSCSFHYACSAFRDKGECEKQDLYQSCTLKNWSSEDILGISQSDRAYCYTCDCLFSLSLSGQKHEMHEYRKNLSDNLLGMPSYLLKPLENSKAHAVTYENHSRLDCDITDNRNHRDLNNKIGDHSNRGQRRDSIVRLFTSLLPSLVPPPKSIEKCFRFCEICQRYSHITNLHCPKCDRCTTKHGPTYVHCDKCNRCRPAKKFHCDQCKHCVSINQCVHQSKRKKLSYNTSDNFNCVREIIDKSLHNIRIYIYPLNDSLMFTSFSQQFISLYNTILSSKYYVNQIEEACIIIPGLDLLYAYPDDNQMIDLSMRYLHHLPRRTIFLIVFQSTDQNLIYQVQYLLLDSRTSNSSLVRPILVLDSSSNQSNTTYNQRFVLVSESPYRQGVEKWIDYSESLCSSEFCLIIDADNLNRFNLYDSLACGCIPVIVNDDIVLPFSEVLDWYKIAIHIPQVKFQKIPSILSTYSSKEKSLLRKQIMFIYQRYFSSIEKIILTTLDILNDRVFPQYSRSYAEWNYPNYSKVGLPISPVLFYPAKAFPRTGFTALIRAHNHFTLLCILLKSIQSVKSLRRIVVVWTNKIYPVPDSTLWPSLIVPLSIVRSAYGSVNGRFFPYRQIITEAVFSIEEDTCLPSVELIERAFEDWPEPRIGSEVVERVDNFTYLGSLISPNVLVSDEISAQIRKARLAFANLRHLWRSRDIRLPIKGRVYCAAVRSVLLCGCETWPLREDTHLLASSIKAFIDDLDTCEDIFFYWFIIQTSNGQSVLSSSGSNRSPTNNYHNYSSNLYNLSNECNITPKHCSFHVSRLKSFVRQFDRTNYYPMKISHITAGAL
ncbi:unnamed protein product [Schistosoma margrebowiei]|uniref:CTCHY-type domain-containing protein n=1 Tax=Schistosoma margrebowiei TaxID=48269 RepID=A0A3P7W5K0_9TREM|nr:unnamed protein product [Schistosoma margrebowiei]